MVTEKKPKALVIGNFRARSGIIDALQGTAFEIIEATESRRGIKHVLDYAPSVVIISPHLTGADAIKALRAIRCLTSAPILLVGSGRETDAWQAHRHGADAFVPWSRHAEMTSSYINILLSLN